MSRKVDKVAIKKKELEQNLLRLQQDLEHNFSEVKGDVGKSVNPTKYVRKYPLPVIGTAVAIGFVMGISGRGKTRTKSPIKSSIAEGIGSSLKKRLSQKAVDMALDYLENRFSGTRNNK
jgi:hypothetical protein